MQINALTQVINYLKEISGNPAILEGYKKLAELTKDASSNPNGVISAEILNEKEQLRKLLLENDPSGWGYASYSLFEKINNNQLFGKTAADCLDDMIKSEGNDYKAINSDLSKKVKLISKQYDTVSRFLQVFDQLVPFEVSQQPENDDDKFSLFLYLEGRLTVQNITDMERYSRLWDGVLSAFSQLTGEEKLTLDIRSFHDGEIVLGAAAKDKTLNAFKTSAIGMLDTLPLVLNIRKIQIEIALLPLHNDLNKLLEEEIQMLINRKAIEIAHELISEFSNNAFISEDLTGDLLKILKQILSFVEKGGRIEFRPAISTPEVIKTNAKLNEFFSLTYDLENATDSLNKVLAEKEALHNGHESGVTDQFEQIY